jgi:hypothetical protein
MAFQKGPRQSCESAPKSLGALPIARWCQDEQTRLGKVTYLVASLDRAGRPEFESKEALIESLDKSKNFAQHVSQMQTSRVQLSYRTKRRLREWNRVGISKAMHTED